MIIQEIEVVGIVTGVKSCGNEIKFRVKLNNFGQSIDTRNRIMSLAGNALKMDRQVIKAVAFRKTMKSVAIEPLFFIAVPPPGCRRVLEFTFTVTSLTGF